MCGKLVPGNWFQIRLPVPENRIDDVDYQINFSNSSVNMYISKNFRCNRVK